MPASLSTRRTRSWPALSIQVAARGSRSHSARSSACPWRRPGRRMQVSQRRRAGVANPMVLSALICDDPGWRNSWMGVTVSLGRGSHISDPKPTIAQASKVRRRSTAGLILPGGGGAGRLSGWGSQGHCGDRRRQAQPVSGYRGRVGRRDQRRRLRQPGERLSAERHPSRGVLGRPAGQRHLPHRYRVGGAARPALGGRDHAARGARHQSAARASRQCAAAGTVAAKYRLPRHRTGHRQRRIARARHHRLIL